jgi:hypothetical protein
MPEPHPFRRAAENEDVEALAATLREDVILHSPVLFEGYEGRQMVAAVMTQVAAILEDFTYTGELAEGNLVVLRFEAKVANRQLDGIDYLELDEDGKVTELTVFMRPLSALTSFNEEMAARLGAG